MIIVEAILGNVGDDDWKSRLDGAHVDALALDHWEAQKNRFRKRSSAGSEVAVSLDRGAFLRDGDILVWSDATRTAIVARITLRDVMIVHVDALAAAAPELMVRTCVELGHALGNQHWPALVKGTHVFFPLTVNRKVMASVMNTHRFENVRYEFVPGAEIIPYLAPHESRRLFGGAEGPVHSHVYDQAAAHGYAPIPVRGH
jgi:urease accessory protein